MRKIFIAILVISFLGCKEDVNRQDNPGIHVRLKSDPDRLLPAILTTPTAREVNQYIFVPLADFDPVSLELSPILITEIPETQSIKEGSFKGGVMFDLEFRPEAQWSDGMPITGEDYLFTIKAIKTPQVNAARYRSYLNYIKDVQVDPDNNKKFKVFFSEDYMLAKETAITIEIYPKHIYDPTDALAGVSMGDLLDSEKFIEATQSDSTVLNFADNFNGIKYSREVVENSGPYQLDSWTSNQTLVLKRKENYWGEGLNIPSLMAGPNKITFHIIPDETTAVNQLKEGNIDIMTAISSNNFKDLQSNNLYNTKLHFFTPQLMKYYYLLLNNSDVVLKDKTVRRALAHLVDVDDFINSLENGLGNRTVGPILPMKSYYEKSLKAIDYNPAKAAELLESGGWKDSNGNGIIDKQIDGKLEEMELEMYVSSAGSLGKNISLLLQEEATKLGIKINVTPKAWKNIRAEHIKKRDYGITPVVAQQDLVLDDPYNKWHSDNNNAKGGNDAAYVNSEIDKVIEAIRASRNTTERNALYKQFQEIVYEDQPVIFLYAPVEKIAVNKRWDATATERRPGYMVNTFQYAGEPVPSSN